jgi:hypothetical protein
VDACDLGLEYEADVRPKGRLRAHPIGALLPIAAEQRRNSEHPKDQSDRLLVEIAARSDADWTDYARRLALDPAATFDACEEST